jgi:hypothetical protein
MNNIANPEEGSLIFVESTSVLYFFDGTIWQSTITSSSGSGGDGDAWNVDGEDVNSVIYRDGQVYIGQLNSTNENLTVQGSAKITSLPVETNLRQVVHYNDGTLGSDQLSRYYNGSPSTEWTTLNIIGSGLIVTGKYYYVGCSNVIGSFQFRYFSNTNTYNIVYNTGNANMAVVGNVLSINSIAPSCTRGVEFRRSGENFQIRSLPDGGLDMNMRIDGY